MGTTSASFKKKELIGSVLLYAKFNTGAVTASDAFIYIPPNICLLTNIRMGREEEETENTTL
jgi:hypothetical protein